MDFESEAVKTEAIKQFLADSSWRMPSKVALPHACKELKALRASWEKALEAVGMTEEEAAKRGSDLWMRAPK